jgi:hypothetical protein
MDSFRKGTEKFPDCQAERLGGDIMLLSTLDNIRVINWLKQLTGTH